MKGTLRMNFVPKDNEITNPVLKKLFVKLKNTAISKGNPAPVFGEIAEEICMNARFLAVVKVAPIALTNASALAGNQSGAQVQFAVLSDKSGNRFYPVFTDIDEFKKWSGIEAGAKTCVVGFDDIAELVDDPDAKGFVINPFGENFLVPTEICKNWREKKQLRVSGHTSKKLDENAEVYISDYETAPAELIGAIAEAAKKSAGIKAVWLREMTVNGEKSHLAIIDTDGDENTEANIVGEAAKPFIGSMTINVVTTASDFGKKATEDAVPVYKA